MFEDVQVVNEEMSRMHNSSVSTVPPVVNSSVTVYDCKTHVHGKSSCTGIACTLLGGDNIVTRNAY